MFQAWTDPEQPAPSPPASLQRRPRPRPRLHGTLLDAAREAFTNGFNVAGAVSAPAVAVLGVLALALLRQVRPSAGESP